MSGRFSFFMRGQTRGGSTNTCWGLPPSCGLYGDAFGFFARMGRGRIHRYRRSSSFSTVNVAVLLSATGF